MVSSRRPWAPITVPVASLLLPFLLLAGCATSQKQARESFHTEIAPASPPVRITNAAATTHSYGVVITGRVDLDARLPEFAVNSVDILIAGPDGKEIRTFTTGYYPTPKTGKRKPQIAHFTMVTYSVPPAGSVVKVSLTPQPKTEEPGQPAPENR